MIALLALGLAAGSAGATPAPYPAAQVIDAFKGLCANPVSADAVRETARAQGWEEFTPPPGSNLGKIVATGRAMVPQIVPKDMKIDLLPFVAFRKTVAGREILASTDAATTSAGGKSVIVSGCQIYDFTAPGMPDDAALKDLVASEPDKKVEEKGLLTVRSWTVGLTGPGSDLMVAYSPPTSPLANPDRMMVLGLVMKSQVTEWPK